MSSILFEIKDAVGFIKKSRINKKKGEILVYGIINKETDELMGTISLVRFLPIVNIYYADAQHLTKAGFYGLSSCR